MNQRAERTALPGADLSLPVRLILVLIALTLIWVGVITGTHYVLRPVLPAGVSQLVLSVVVGALATVTIWAACRWLDRGTPGQGVPGRAVLGRLGLGFSRSDARACALGGSLWLGLAVVGLAVGASAGAFQIQFGAPSAAFAGLLLLQLVLVFCYEAFPEELAFRGYVFTNLAEVLSGWVAVLVQALLFVAWAFALVGLLALFGIEGNWQIGTERFVLFFTMGVTVALVRLWTGSLWGSIGYHLAFQTIVQLLGTGQLVIIEIADEAGLQNALVVLWLFTVVLGGMIAAFASWRRQRRLRPALSGR